MTTRSRTAAWMLVDSPLGWLTRDEVAALLDDADARAAAAEDAAARAAYDAALARYEHERLVNRRAVKLSTTLASSRRPAALRTLPARLRDSLAPHELGDPPQPPSAPAEVGRNRAAADELAERALLPPRPVRTPPFPHLRVLHLGAAARFAGLAPHTPIERDTWADQLAAGADLVLVEPPDGDGAWDPFDGQLASLLRAAGEAGIPTVRISAGGGGSAGPGTPTLELTEGHGGGDAVTPSVDTGLFNPYGWRIEPPDPVVAVLATDVDDAGRRLLAGFDPPVTVVRPPDLDAPDGVRFTRRVASPAGLRRSLIRAGVLLDHPSWRGDPATALRRWHAALACGTPVVTCAVDEVTAAPPPGVIEVAEDELADRAHRLLVDAELRERHSITGRRWALRNAAREPVLREILGHLGTPLPAPERVTVLLSTNRPEMLAHGLDSVARQNHPGVDVCLVLHGEAFDDVDPPVRDGLVSSVIRAPSGWVLGDCLNAALDAAGGELVAKMDDDDHYGADHLADLVDAWRYSGADVVGKPVEYVHLADRGVTVRRSVSNPERDRRHVGGPTPLASREVLRRHRFLRVPNRVDTTLYDRVLADGGRIYGIHARDFVLERHGDGHAWDVEDASFLEHAVAERGGFDWAMASSDPNEHA